MEAERCRTTSQRAPQTHSDQSELATYVQNEYDRSRNRQGGSTPLVHLPSVPPPPQLASAEPVMPASPRIRRRGPGPEEFASGSSSERPLALGRGGSYDAADDKTPRMKSYGSHSNVHPTELVQSGTRWQPIAGCKRFIQCVALDIDSTELAGAAVRRPVRHQEHQDHLRDGQLPGQVGAGHEQPTPNPSPDPASPPPKNGRARSSATTAGRQRESFRPAPPHPRE